MSDIFDNLKRMKAFEKLFLGINNNKIILKDLDNPLEHLTMLFTKNGVLDVHRTTEGEEKEYESLGQFDLVKTVLKIISEPKGFENAMMEFLQSIKEVNFDEPEYSDYHISPLKTKEEIAHHVKKEKRGLVIPKEAIEEFDITELLIPWKNAKNVLKNNALVYDKNKVPIGYLFIQEEKFFYIAMDVLEKSSIAKLISQMTNPEKSDEKTS